MRLKNQTSLKRLTSKKSDLLNNKPSSIVILLIMIALMQMPISLKASFNLVCLFYEAGDINKTLFICND